VEGKKKRGEEGKSVSQRYVWKGVEKGAREREGERNLYVVKKASMGHILISMKYEYIVFSSDCLQ